jgi:hypothetical protein
VSITVEFPKRFLNEWDYGYNEMLQPLTVITVMPVDILNILVTV